MTTIKDSGVTSFKSFLTYQRHFFHYCYVLRMMLGLQLALIFLGGTLFAWVEGLPIHQGLYFSMITSTSVGFGDITPETGAGQFISVVLGCIGLIMFGLVVAVANKAFKVTIEEYLQVEVDTAGN